MIPKTVINQVPRQCIMNKQLIMPPIPIDSNQNPTSTEVNVVNHNDIKVCSQTQTDSILHNNCVQKTEYDYVMDVVLHIITRFVEIIQYNLNNKTNVVK